MQNLISMLERRRDLIVLALMLESLHLAIWLDFGSPISRSFMLVHLGLFLIWQPVWRGDEKLAWHNGLLFLVLTLAFVVWIDWWLLFGWLALLTGFCGGRVVISQQERAVNMLVLLMLVSELLIPCTSGLFGVPISREVAGLFSVLLPALPLFITLIPVHATDSRQIQSVDILHAIATAMLVTLLIVGSLLYMYRSHVEYLEALFHTLIIIGVFLFIISWLLTPHAGFSGLSQLWLRSLLNIGTPFERWLTELSSVFEQETSPEEFLEATIEQLVGLPWISGVGWHTHRGKGEVGERSRYTTTITVDELTITMHTGSPVGGALYLHCQLLVQLIANFHVAKVREVELTKQTHLQAIYETGARVTHDIKNLLQSLQAITSIILYETDETAGSVSQKLLKRQLPHLTQRLQLALDKLQTPSVAALNEVYLKDWWQDLQNRNPHGGLRFHADIVGDPLIPSDLFDSVIENLLENVRKKMQMEPGLAVHINVFSDGSIVSLSISDSGLHIPDEKARRLLHEPLKSESGLGIGLYQAARQAESMGYRLTLADNQDGNVRFELATSPKVTAGPDRAVQAP